jgi:hypothetical protein
MQKAVTYFMQQLISGDPGCYLLSDTVFPTNLLEMEGWPIVIQPEENKTLIYAEHNGYPDYLCFQHRRFLKGRLPDHPVIVLKKM